MALDEHPLAKLLRSVAPSLRADLLNASIGNQSPQDLVVGDEVLMAATMASDAEQRGAGYRLLVQCASLARDETSLGQMLHLDEIAQTANWKSQHLLEPLLTGRPQRGRFGSKRDVTMVPLLSGGFRRWNPAQMQAYARLVTALVSNPNTSARGRHAAIRIGATIPEFAHPFAEAQVRVDPTDGPRVESALAALAWSDGPDLGIPNLLGYANTEYARVALYSIGRAVRRSLAASVGTQMSAVALDDRSKVTSRKEAIRLIRQFRPPGADTALSALVNQPAGELHRDVRIALAWAAVQNPRSPWTPAAFTALADGGRDEQFALLQFDPLVLAPVL